MRPLHSPPDAPSPFPDHLPQADGRLSGRKLALVAGLLGAALVALVGWRLFAKEAGRAVLQPAPLPAESDVMPSSTSTGEASLKLPQSYAGWDRRPAESLPPIPEAKQIILSSAGPASEPPLVSQGPAATPPASGQAQTPEKTPPASGTRAPAAAPKEPKKPSKWLFADVKPDSGIQVPPFPLPQDEGDEPVIPSAGPAPGKGKGVGHLILKADWEIPADPTKVLYASQVINGQLAQAFNSDTPGTLRILITEQVEDRFGQGQVLIPQYAIALAVQAAKPSLNQASVDVTVTRLEFPNGAVVALNGQVGDPLGQTGMPGTVDNHWIKTIAAAGIGAVLSIGTRLPAGNQEGFAPTIGQDVSRDAAGSIAQSSGRIVQRQFEVSPTFREKAGAPVTLQFKDNISFMTKPVVITK
jgi:type IV secretory pathway VirB10-like protein